MFQCCCTPADQQQTIDLIPTSPAVQGSSKFDAAGAAQDEGAAQNKDASAKADVVVEKKQPEAPTAAVSTEPPTTVEPLAVVEEGIPAGSEYKVTVEKPKADSPLGLTCEILGKALMVLSVEEGPVKAYNSTAKPEEQVNVGDFVTEVNGVVGDRGRLYDGLVKGKKLDMVFRRPSKFTISIDKSPTTSLGMELDYLTDGACLLITAVRAGPITDWNKDNAAKTVKADDRIVTVNGKKGTAEKLMEALKNSTKLELEIVRAS